MCNIMIWIGAPLILYIAFATVRNWLSLRQ